MNGEILVCIHCGRSFDSNPRVKNQRYCSDRECRKARRARWQRQKMGNDPDYRGNQRLYQKRWLAAHPGYYSNYRAVHPGYVETNRLLQIRRDAKRRKDRLSKLLAKMDSLSTGLYTRRGGLFRLVPQDGRLIAKMDSLIVRLTPIRGYDYCRLI